MKSGFYLELKTKGSGSTVKIRRDTRAEMEMAMQMYGKSKEVTYLGEVREGRWVDGKNKGKKTR